MAEVVKDWDAYEQVAVPLTGARPLRGLKRGRPVSAGQPLARHPDPRRGDAHSSINGVIEEINEIEIIVRRDDEAVGEPPLPADPAEWPTSEQAARLKELGLDPPRVRPGQALIVSALDAEPGLTFSAALFGEHRETVLAGVEILSKLHPGRKIVWAARQREQAPAEAETVVVKEGYPHSLPALIKKRITGISDPRGEGVFDGRALHLLGRIYRTGLPLTKMPLTLGEANYFVPVGARIIDLLTFANLVPHEGDAVVEGGLIRGRCLSRLERGADKSVTAVHLARRAEIEHPSQNCRRCRECARACPVGLPVDIVAGRRPEQWLAEPPDPVLEGCLRCGACAPACPAGRPLMSLIRLLPQASEPFAQF